MKPREFMTFGALCFRVGDLEGEMTIKKRTSGWKFPFLFRIEKLLGLVNSFFFDSCFLTGKSTQVVQFSATNFTYLVHFDAIDSR